MKRILGWVFLSLMMGCPMMPAGDAGSGGGSESGGGASLGGGIATGGGSAASGGGDVGGGSAGGGAAPDGGFPSLDAGMFLTNWVDDGGILIGCEVPAILAGAVPSECSPSTTGCHAATDCASHLCLKLASQSVCTTACTSSASCQPGWVCQLRWTGAGQTGFCLPGRRTP